MIFKYLISIFIVFLLAGCGDPPPELADDVGNSSAKDEGGGNNALLSNIKTYQKREGKNNYCVGGSKGDDGKTISVNQTLILVDLTDELRDNQVQYIADNYINDLNWDSMGDSFGLARITNQAPEEMKVFTLCAPDPIEKNNSQVNKGSVSKFKKTFSEVYEQLLNANGLSSANSMLIEGVRQVFTNKRYSFLPENGPRHLIFVSDLMQNSSEISFYECKLDKEECKFNSIKEKKSAWFDAAKLNLNENDRVTIYHLSAECKADLNAKDWWIAYFKNEGAGEVNVISELGNNDCKQKVVEKPVIKEKIIEKEVEVEKEVIVEVPKIKEKIIEKEVEVEKEVIVEVPVEKIVEKKVEVPVIKEKEVIVCSGKGKAGPNTFQKDIFCN
jgi:hypothetical protein